MSSLDRALKFATDEEKQSVITKLITELPMDRIQEEVEERTGIVHVGDFLEAAERRITLWGKFMGLSSGYPIFDPIFKGFVGGEIILVGGYTSHGKTQLAANFAYNIANAGHRVLFVTLEMTHEELSTRFLKMHLSSDKDKEDFIKLPISMQKQQTVDYKEVGLIAQRAKDEGAEIVFVDYIQYMTGEARDERLELTRIVKSLKRQALETGLPYVVLSQINRPERDEKGEPRPTIKDFKGTSALEHAADVAMYVWRKSRTDPFIQVGMLKNRNRGYDDEVVIFQSSDGAKMVEMGIKEEDSDDVFEDKRVIAPPPQYKD